MKLSNASSRIVGLLLTEFRLATLTNTGLVAQARFALVDAETNVVAESSRSGDFSAKVGDAISALITALEEDQARVIFTETSSETSTSEDPDPIADIPTF